MDHSLRDKIQTVMRPMSPNEFFGITLCHEHLHIRTDFVPLYIPDRKENKMSFTLANRHWISQHPFSYKENLVLAEPLEIIAEELGHYQKAGGKNLVELTTHGISPNPSYLKSVAQRMPGLNIVMGTGYYVCESQKPHIIGLSIQRMCEKMQKDIVTGFADDTSVKAGVLGEVGCSWPLTDFEKRSLKAAGIVHEATGCPITIHPGRDTEAPGEILRNLLEAGARAKKVVIGHLDRTLNNAEDLLELASSGCYCEWDMFGIETSNYQPAPHVDMPSDAQRIKAIKVLLENGYEDQIVLSHDMHTKHRLMRYGGHGFAHILNTVVGMMLRRGITKEQVDKMLKINPTEFLTFN